MVWRRRRRRRSFAQPHIVNDEAQTRSTKTHIMFYLKIYG
jgi:hypothetical protein